MIYLQVAAVVIPLIALIAGAVVFMHTFRTKTDCDRFRDECSRSRTIDSSRVEKSLGEMWVKIDQIHEWMITGIIKIQRTNNS